ncbi:MAG TPA: hypothetical protein PKL97_04645 [Candidatus Omnitrophota bacterium]|nr:hypothetical protein [Candidatus Omnitrophota bacterium]
MKQIVTALLAAAVAIAIGYGILVYLTSKRAGEIMEEREITRHTKKVILKELRDQYR